MPELRADEPMRRADGMGEDLRYRGYWGLCAEQRGMIEHVLCITRRLRMADPLRMSSWAGADSVSSE